MRKKWLSLLLVLCFLMAAGSAFGAVSVPNQLQGTSWHFTGFQMRAINGTAEMPAAVYFNQNMTAWKNGTGAANYGPAPDLAGGLYLDEATPFKVYNRTASETTNASMRNQTDAWIADSTGPLGKVTGVLRLTDWDGAALDNSTGGNATYYCLANRDYSLLAGISKMTMRGSGYTADATGTGNFEVTLWGANMGVMVRNQTIADGMTIKGKTVNALAELKAGTWYYYAIGNKNGTDDLTAYFGKLTFANNTRGTATLFAKDTNGAENDLGATTTFDYAIADGCIRNATVLLADGTGNFTLFSNATLSKSRNILVGYSQPGDAYGTDGSVRFAIALKGAALLTESDFKSNALRYVNIGNGTMLTTSAKPTASIGVLYHDEDMLVTNGNRTILGNYTATGANGVSNLDLTNYSWVVGTSAALNTVTHGNATFCSPGQAANSTFLGRKKDNVMVGIHTSDEQLALMLVFPSAPQVGAVEGNLNNATANNIAPEADFGTATRAEYVAQVADGVQPGAAGGSADDEEVTTLSNAELIAQFRLNAGAQMTLPPQRFHHQVNTSGAADSIYVTGYTFKGGVQGRSVADLGTMYKFHTSTNATAGFTANSTRAFAMRTPGQTITDGMWWVTPNDIPGLVLTSANTMEDNITYRVNIAIQDNGPYDADGRTGFIRDPSGPLSGIGGGGEEGSSDDEGCVFNPAASMSLEFLLLLLVPVAYLIRRRKK